MSAQPYLTDSVRYFRLQGPLARHLLRAGRNPVSRFPTGSALCRAVIPAHTASADFCRSIPTPYGAGSPRQIDRPPRVRRATFLPYTRRIYFHTFRVTIGLWISWPPRICGFCSSGREFACSFLRIPPLDGHPCCSAGGSRHQGPQGTFTPKSPVGHHGPRIAPVTALRAMPGAQRTGPGGFPRGR